MTISQFLDSIIAGVPFQVQGFRPGVSPNGTLAYPVTFVLNRGSEQYSLILSRAATASLFVGVAYSVDPLADPSTNNDRQYSSFDDSMVVISESEPGIGAKIAVVVNIAFSLMANFPANPVVVTYDDSTAEISIASLFGVANSTVLPYVTADPSTLGNTFAPQVVLGSIIGDDQVSKTLDLAPLIGGGTLQFACLWPQDATGGKVAFAINNNVVAGILSAVGIEAADVGIIDGLQIDDTTLTVTGDYNVDGKGYTFAAFFGLYVVSLPPTP